MSVSPEEVDGVLHRPTALYGSNARSKARRGRELLGWAPSHVSLEDDIERTVQLEAKSLGRT